jgi:hypothetical protein
MERTFPQLLGKKKFKNQLPTGKLMLTYFWNSQGLVLKHLQQRGTTINSALYSEMFTDRLKPEIQSKP